MGFKEVLTCLRCWAVRLMWHPRVEAVEAAAPDRLRLEGDGHAVQVLPPRDATVGERALAAAAMHRPLVRQRSERPFEVRLRADVMRRRVVCGLRGASFYHQLPKLVGLEHAPERLARHRLHDSRGGGDERARRRRAREATGVRIVVAFAAVKGTIARRCY